jgi:hypothetical protein
MSRPLVKSRIKRLTITDRNLLTRVNADRHNRIECDGYSPRGREE